MTHVYVIQAKGGPVKIGLSAMQQLSICDF